MKTGLFSVTKCSLFRATGLGGLLTIAHLTSAQSWEPISPTLYWRAIAGSADLSKLIATGGTAYDYLPIYKSVDSGMTWTQTSAPTNLWRAVASSADGTKLLATDGETIYCSADSGTTWVQTSAPTNNNWEAIASSADGTKLVGVGSGNGDGSIYISTNSGGIWIQANAPSNSWETVASSADGAKLLAASFGIYGDGMVYTSTNSGVTWRPTSAPIDWWSSVACSADGRTMVAASVYEGAGFYEGGDGAIYISTNAGVTWTPTGPPGGDWFSVACSADGTRLAAAVADFNGAIYTSTNSGATWSWSTDDTTDVGWYRIISAADGNKLWAISAPGYPFFSDSAGQMWTWPCSSSWQSSDAPITYAYTSVASSADGTKLVAAANFENGGPGRVYTSSNSGMTWVPTSAPSDYWSSVASSADGTKLVAAAGYYPGQVYRSSDSGATWAPTSAPSNYWSSVASSADGTKLVAAARADSSNNPGRVYTSSDSGATWNATSAPSNSWSSVTSSADGTKLLAAYGYNYNDGLFDGLLYTSSDSGATWNPASAPSNAWTCVASSADGSILVAGVGNSAVNDYLIYISTNSGATWTSTGEVGNWSSIAVSTDANRVVAAENASASGRICISTNSGVTWTSANAPAQTWQAVACSASGSNLVAVGYAIYTLKLPLPPPPPPPSLPHLQIAEHATNLDVSWLVPSTRFGLQESTDLSAGNWTDVASPPVLNYSNLNYEVTVSPPSGSHFYRLRSP